MNTTRDELLKALGELGEVFPTMRFGQLLSNVAYFAKGPTQTAVWDAEDEELLQAARRHMEQAAAREGQGRS